MPAKSKEQKKFFQLVLAYKEGEVDEDEVSQDVIDTAKDMSKEEIKKFATGPVEETVTETRIREIVREELRESYGKQLQNYGVDDFHLDKLYRELEERGLKIVDDGRFTYVRKGDAGARIVELEQDGKRTVKGLFTSNNDKMRGTKSSRHSFDDITIEALATKIASSLRAQQKYS